MKKTSFKKTLMKNFTFLSVITMFSATSAHASKLGDFADGLNGDFTKIFSLALLAVGVWFIVKRDWFKMFGFIAAAVIIGLFTNIETVKKLGNTIYNYFLG